MAMISRDAVEAIEASDTDELLRVVDGYCASRAWEELVELRARCREATTRGKQVWGVEEHIRYRLALEAPSRWAGPVVTEGPARFAPGPLAEVAASTKTWSEMEPYLAPGPERLTFAAERVIRGERGIGPIPDLPDHLLSWEPSYPLATYRPDKLEAPSPRIPSLETTTLPDSVSTISDVESEAALADLVEPWRSESNGRYEVVSVEGEAVHAIAALGLSMAPLAQMDTASALRWMAWAGASGGAHGRRRGSAAGRYGAWWVMTTLCDLVWPPDPEAIETALPRLRWYWFDDGSPATGWHLRLAVEDTDSALAWSVSAFDTADEEAPA